MRIALVHNRLDNKGGAENIVMWTADGLRRRGHEVAVFAEAFDLSLWPRDMTAGLRMETMKLTRLPGRFSSRRLRQWQMGRVLARVLTDCDVVVANHSPTPIACIKARAASGGRWPVVWLCQEPKRLVYRSITDKHLLNWEKHGPAGVPNDHLHHVFLKKPFHKRLWRSLKDARTRRWDREAARGCDLVVANSAFSAANIKEAFGANSVVCHMGAPMLEALPYVQGDYVGVLTTLNAVKNVDNVIRAIADLARRGQTDIPLYIAGRGLDRLRLEHLARNLGIGDRVRFLGALRDEAIHEFYRNARALVYCPIDEPFGLVPIEAQAAQTPVIVSNHGGPAEIVEDGVTGIHVNPFDPSAIADAIQTLWRDTDLNRRMAQAACERSRARFSLTAFLDRFEPLLLQCVEWRAANAFAEVSRGVPSILGGRSTT